MMFFTPVKPHPLEQKIKHKEPIITAGSCFADCMGDKFSKYKFPILPNPFGTVYNPLSLNSQFSMAINQKILSHEKIAEAQGQFIHYDFHSSLAKSAEKDLKIQIDQVLQQTHEFLKTARHLILTWGTAWAYKLKDTGSIVANCHKQPASKFDKILLSADEITNDFNEFYALLKGFNPHIKIILTVSPVRHIKDTLELNAVSKSILRVAAHHISSQLKDVTYFPSYEIMTDELRDYRFYKEDMIHPTPQAEDYIWNKFTSTSIDKETLDFIEKWDEISKAMEHRPFNPASEGHKKFIKNTLNKLYQLKGVVNVDKEIKHLEEQL